MNTPSALRDEIVEKYRKEDPRLDPVIVGRIVDDVTASLGRAAEAGRGRSEAPFAVAWMDSYLAHWLLGQQVAPEKRDRMDELGPAVRDLMDTRFAERVAAIREWIDRIAEPPDGGPPEPGVPPVGPSAMEPPDGGPPEPGVPPVGPEFGFPGENPWILYWFVSLKLPMLVDMLDAHLERRLSELGFVSR